MEKLFKCLTAICLITFFSACHKPQTDLPTTGIFLSNKYTLDSIIGYANNHFTGVGIKVANVTGYSDFVDGKYMYSSYNNLLPGVINNLADSSNYFINNTDSIITRHKIEMGGVSANADSLKILQYKYTQLSTGGTLVLGTISYSPFNLYYKFYYHR